MDVNITYETLFDTLRKEKSSPELQDLESTFYDEVNDYLSEKIKTYEESNDPKTEKQLQNIKKIVREIFERRQKKLLLQAFSQGRAQKQLAFTTKLSEEQYFVKNVLEIIAKHNVLLDKTLEKNNKAKEVSVPVVEKTEETEGTSVKFLTKLPKFLGKDLESYGPYEKGDTALLPPELAKILIDKGRAENA